MPEEEKLSVGGVEFTNISGSQFTIGSIVTSQTVGGDFVSGDKVTLNLPRPSALSPAEARDLNILLKNVENFWIKGALERSLYQTVLLDLGKEIRAEAVDHPLMVWGRPGEIDQLLPTGTKISEVFDKTPLLLILGEPGSGKTITLLELARDLISRFRTDSSFAQPVPVVFNLSTWTDKRQSLNNWMIEELRSKYQTPRHLGRPWLEQGYLLPLLDGLDEVNLKYRTACVEAINHFSLDYGRQGLVVCSRIRDYTDLPVRLKFNGALYIRPLTSNQISEYLSRVGSKLEGLRDLLQQDKPLRTLAQFPLMLNIMSLAYQERPVEDLLNQSSGTIEGRRKELFDTYIQQMFDRRGKEQSYSNEQTKEWLCWLAWNMKQHNQTIFLIEQLQPSWITSLPWHWVYILGSRFLSVILAWLGLGLIGGGWLGGLLGGLFIGPASGPIVGLINGIHFERKSKPNLIVNILIIGSISGLISILVNGLIVGSLIAILSGSSYEWHNALTFGLFGGLFSGLIFGLIFGLRSRRQSLTSDIQTVEVLHWSWQKALKNMLVGLFVGVCAGLLVGLCAGLFNILRYGLTNMLVLGGLVIALLGGLVFALIGGLFGGLFGGLSGSLVETKTTPNQGISLSLKNAIFTSFIGGPISGLVGGLFVGLNLWLTAGWIVGLGAGLFGMLYSGLGAGLLTALWYGGFDIIHHYVLRFILWYLDHTPSNYIRFLDYCTERIFLRKVGGGYIFIHRYLMEHFASLRPEMIKNKGASAFNSHSENNL